MDIYAEIILDHYKNPRHFELIEDAQLISSDSNPLCGDKITVSLKLDKNNVIENFGFEGSGCAISMASTSLLSEQIIGKTINDVKNISNEDIFKLLEIKISPARVKCALLGLSCIKKAIKWYQFQKK